MSFTAKRKGVQAFPSLQVLRFHIYPDQIQSYKVYDVFDHVQRLETLSIDINLNEFNLTFSFTPCFQNQLKTLKHIAVEVSFRFGSQSNVGECHQSIVRSLCDALESLKKQNIVEEITLDLHLHMENAHHALSSETRPSFTEWERLDQVLMEDRVNDFPRLRSVKISVSSQAMNYTPMVVDGKEVLNWIFQEFLEDPLHRLYSTTELDFVASFHPSYRSSLNIIKWLWY
ncbi:hypothetical protein BJ165DRAFT_674244 [Panaeolus papilionaceus]|nr:hypothetical protein BJ165DRAFT_674244 [Panaeolus papilionaceus]